MKEAAEMLNRAIGEAMERVDRKIDEARAIQDEIARRTEVEEKAAELICQCRFDEANSLLNTLGGEADGMAGKKGGRRTTDECAIREKAAKMRAMTDEELVHYVEDRVEKARSEGFRNGAGRMGGRGIMDTMFGACLTAFADSFDKALFMIDRLFGTECQDEAANIMESYMAQWLAWKGVLSQLTVGDCLFVHGRDCYGIRMGKGAGWLLKVDRANPAAGFNYIV